MARQEYSPTQWATAVPITQEKMNKIENELKLLSQQDQADETSINNLNDAISGTNGVATKVANLESKIGTDFVQGYTITQRISSLESANQSSDSSDEWVLAQLHGAVDNINGRTDHYNTLDERIYGIETRNSQQDALITAHSNILETAKGTNYSTLGERIDAIEGQSSTLLQGYNSINQSLTNAGGVNNNGESQTLMARLNAIDGGSNPTRTLPNVIAEITDAHGTNNVYGNLNNRFSTIETEIEGARVSHALASDGVDKQYVSVDARFEAIEEELVGTNAISSRIDTLAGNVSDLSTNKINTTAIANNLTTVDAGKVLDARQGKTLNEAKVNYTDIVDDVTHTDPDKPLSANQGKLLKDAINTINTNIGATEADGLRGRITALETEVDMTSANSRIDLVETEVANARTSTVVRTPGANDGDPDTDTTYGSLDARLEAIETHAADVRTDVNTIANELNMFNQAGVIQDATTRIDTIEKNVLEIGKEIGMISDLEQVQALSDVIDRTNTDIDKIKTELGDARREHSGHFEEDSETHEQIELDDTLELHLSDIEEDIETINDTLGSGFDTTTNTVAATIAAAITTAEGYTDTKNSDYNVAEINEAHRTHSGHFEENEETHEQVEIDDTLDLRFEDIEGRLDAIDTPSTGTIAGLDGRIETLEGTINTANTGLSARMSNAESAITTLQTTPKSATVIIAKERIIYDNEGVPTVYENDYVEDGTNTAITPSTDVDYLFETEVNEETKYFYWKYIDDSWELISGGIGGGTGSSSGMFAASLTATDIPTPDINTDYFVGNNTIGYTHYRYVIDNDVGSFVKILPKGLLANVSVNSNGKPIITTLEDSNTNVLNSFNALKTVNCVTTYDTDGTTPKSYSLSFTDINGQEYTWDLAAGGGGSAYIVQFINDSNLELYVPNDATSAILPVHIYARLGNQLLSQTGSITVKSKAESASNYTIERVIANVANNTVTNIDVIDLLTENSVTNIQLTASIQPEDTPITRNLTYTIHRVPMSIEAYNYNPASVKTSNFNFQYYCVGSNLSKIVHFIIDDNETTEDIGTPANTDLLTKQISVASLSRGMHSLKVYFTVGSFSSNEINTYFLYDNNTEVNKPMIALSTNKTIIQDGENLNLKYTVYTKGFETTEEVTLETYTLLDNVRNTYESKIYTNVINSIENSVPITIYPSSGTFYMTMTAKHTVNNVEYIDSKTISVTITEYQSAYDTQMTRAGMDNLIYEYDAAGRTNNDSDKEVYEHQFTAVSGDSETFTATNTNFNWASNGYTNGSSLVISGGAVHTINVPLFLASTDTISLETDTDNDDILKNGRTFEIDYEVNSATQLNAEIASFGNGLKITPSVSYLVPQGTTVTVNSHGLIEKEDEICAAYLATGKRMHMTFVIEPKSTEPTSQGEYHQCVNIYINGEFVNSCPYALSDNFSTNSTFTIGSNTCIIKLYSVHMYNRGLTNDEVLKNYMMAPTTKIDRINRFAANDVLNGNKLVDYNKARNKFNCLLITGEISPYKKDTKTPSGVTLTKPDFENLTYTTEFNLLDKKENGTYYSSNNVQGTSSQTYPIHNLKVYLAKEAIDSDTGEKISKKHKYSLKGANGIAESTLCWKADYMSTDHANTLNANFANDLFTDKLPSQVADPQVQNTVYGIRCLLFQRDDENSSPVFIADGCLNNDKGNNNAFGLVDKSYDEAEISEGVTRPLNDTTRQKWEFTNNSSALDFFRADGLLAQSNGDFYAKTAFESTYPDEGDLEDEGLEPNYNHLQVLMTWVHQRANFWDASTTVGTGGTYNGTSYSTERELKKAIFINEFQQHFNLNHILTYHLFSEFIALCDNRAKNMFLRCDDVRTEVVLDTSNNEIFNGNSNPNASFFENTTNIGTQNDPIYALSNANQINWTDSTFAIWYPVLYDLDSCYGVENVGRITIPYDAEWNYSYNGKNQFSGVESRLWLMVEEAFSSELKTLAQTLYPNSLNYNTFYTKQIEEAIESTCPAIINQDMLLKFDAYWADGFIDYSLPNNPHVYRDYKYIQRGSRAFQKDTFIKLRANYLSSKYVTSNFMNDQIRFRSSVIVPVSNSGITLTANQTLYPAITYGDNKEAIRSVNKIGPGESVTLQASDQVGNTDTIHIGGASALTDIGDISKFEPYNLDVSGGVNLKSLVIGSNVVNASTNKIDGLGSCTLLETLNVRNCTNLSGTLSLRANGLIRNIYAAGSGITNIELRDGGNLTNIEYGAATTSITIIDHKGLQNFVYEDSENNHYANVAKLWIENTPNVPVLDIINSNLNNLTGGIRLIGIDIDLFTGIVTEGKTEQQIEEETDAAYNTTTLFLEKITSDLTKGKRLNSNGILLSDNQARPEITGKIRINHIRTSLLDTIHTLYPNLVVYNTLNNDGTANNITDDEFNVYYLDYTGDMDNPLYIDHKMGGEKVIDPAYDTNPITGRTYLNDELPTKPQDAEWIYSFGTYTTQNGQSKYRRFSGWVIQGTTDNPTASTEVNGQMVFVAYFPTKTKRRYTVNWYDKPNGTIKKTKTVDYGTDLSAESSPIETGSLQRIDTSGTTTKVFSGWNRPLGKITSNVNVIAQWQSSSINSNITSQELNLSTCNAADIYALSRLTSSEKQTLLRDRLGEAVFIPFGLECDYNVDDIITTNLLANQQLPLKLEGSADEAIIYNSITPLSLNSDWTFAIDYKFLIDNRNSFNNGNEFVLASCYRNASSAINGFKVSLVRTPDSNIHTIQVTWGTASTIIDYASTDINDISYLSSYRNIVVLSHNSSYPTELRVSYVKPNITNNNMGTKYGADIGQTISNTILEYDSNTNINAPLIIGGNYSGSTTTIEESQSTRRPAQAIIYWAKFWNTDIGEQTCMNMASCVHETIPFLLSGYNDGVQTEYTNQIYTNSTLSFVAAQNIGDRYLYVSRTNGSNLDENGRFGWATSDARKICGNIFYSGIPEEYKSIIQKTAINSLGKDVELRTTGIQETQDYLFLPAYRELDDVSSESIYNEVNTYWTGPWHWFKPSEHKVLAYDGNSNTRVTYTTDSTRVFRYRFSGAYIGNDTRIFAISTDPTYRALQLVENTDTDLTVHSGDIWINTNTGVAYVYISDEQISLGEKIDILANNSTIGGGWRQALIWNLRTQNSDTTSAHENRFIRILTTGLVDDQAATTQYTTEPRLLCPEFTV